MSIHTIETLTRNFSQARRVLRDRVDDLREEKRKLTNRRMPGIRSALAETQEAQSLLDAAIAAEPHLFNRPRSIVVDGIKVGLQKKKGKIIVVNQDKVIERLEKKHPEEAELCIKTQKKLIKSALNNLDARTLKSIGITLAADTDTVLIKPTDSELDKLIDALLEDSDEEAVA